LLLPLVRSLTALSPSCVVWKNADLALAGIGDIDLVASAGVWDSIVGQVRAWAVEAGLGPVVVCRHLPDGMFVIALNGEREFFQVDVRSRATFRGSTVFRVQDLAPMTEMDRRGFRRLRPGAEGLLKLVLKGLDRGGRPRSENLQSEGVLELIASDAPGVREAAALFRPVSNALMAGAECFRAGAWNRPAMLAVEIACRLKALSQPRVAFGRACFRAFHMKRCPLLRASIQGHRRPPLDYAGWLSRVAGTHPVFGLDASSPARGPGGPR
jgi:hypothetical protein